MSSITLSKVTPFLMFTGRAEEALNLYTRLFDDAQFDVFERYGPRARGRRARSCTRACASVTRC
jgi:predicted 3-demethylubiquinone-9 3-methyltransferase (glyoxalase superfamily)